MLPAADRAASRHEDWLAQDLENEKVDFTQVDEVGGVEVDEVGRMKEIDDLKEVEQVHEQTSKSIFTKLNIVADETRAQALSQLLRGKTPQSVIKTRVGRGGKKFSYVEGWYVKKMLNALFAMQWDFELLPVKEGELFYMNSRQVIVMGKLTIRDTNGVERIVKMGVGKKEIAYQRDEHGKSSNTPVDIGNDIKAAETDALKRCATGVGIALDLYAKED
jgi:recombination DNA repair RAD52 pathway protein